MTPASHWWDMFLIHLKWTHESCEVHLGVVFALAVLLIVFRFVRWCSTNDEPTPVNR